MGKMGNVRIDSCKFWLSNNARLRQMTARTVVPFPSLNDVDVQWLELERQRAVIRLQAELLQKKESNNDR